MAKHSTSSIQKKVLEKKCNINTDSIKNVEKNQNSNRLHTFLARQC